MSSWESFIEQATDAMFAAEELEGPGAAFGRSVAKKLYQMIQTVESREDVTAAQWAALHNMREGVAKWN